MNEEDILKDDAGEEDDLGLEITPKKKDGVPLDDEDTESIEELADEEDEVEEPFDDVDPV